MTALPFEPIDLQTADLVELVSRCEIDHAIGPVVDTRGGSVAGYQSLESIQGARSGRICETAKQRVARWSQSHVGLFALWDGVTTANCSGGSGDRQCRQRKVSGRVADLAGTGLLRSVFIAAIMINGRRFRIGHRPLSKRTRATSANNVYTWEELARAQTNDAFWNAAQISLLRQGELHNNVRMTWGKAILNWTKSPQASLAIDD